MALTSKASERNADARAVLAAIYEAHGRSRGGQVIVDVGSADAEKLGMSRAQCLGAAERLVERGLLKRVGLTAYSIEPRGVDASEDPEDLDTLLPVLRGAPAVQAPDTRSSSAHVAAALADAEAALTRGEPGNAIDRVHTAMHTRVRELCDAHGIALADQASLPAAYSRLWTAHPSAANARPESERILRSLGAVVEALNTLRNQASLAHPGKVADDADALLAISAARTLTAYLEARFAVPSGAPHEA